MATKSVSNDILGTGWQFPVHVPRAGRGGIALTRYERDVQEAIRIILFTSKGERRMRPTFGCDIHTLVFAPANAQTFGLMEHYVQEALAMWEPRINVLRVEVEQSNKMGQIDIFVSYELRSTKDERTLVFPFYIAGEE